MSDEDDGFPVLRQQVGEMFAEIDALCELLADVLANDDAAALENNSNLHWDLRQRIEDKIKCHSVDANAERD